MHLFSYVDQKQMNPRLPFWSKISMSVELVIIVLALIAAGGVKITIGDINIGSTRKDDTNRK